MKIQLNHKAEVLLRRLPWGDHEATKTMADVADMLNTAVANLGSDPIWPGDNRKVTLTLSACQFCALQAMFSIGTQTTNSFKAEMGLG